MQFDSHAWSTLLALASSRNATEAEKLLDSSIRATAFGQSPELYDLMELLYARAVDVERLERLAGTDDLTGLANRRTWQASLEREMARIERHGGSLAIAMIDLDDLKLINDSKGHETGNFALKALAEVCKRTFRATDLVARIGGDEFAVLMPDVKRAGAERAAARFQVALSDVTANGRTLHACVGIAVADGLTTTLSELLERADAELYDQKRKTRTGRSAPAILQ